MLGRNQLLLDLTKPEVRDYIVENISRILDSTGIFLRQVGHEPSFRGRWGRKPTILFWACTMYFAGSSHPAGHPVGGLLLRRQPV